MVSIQLLTLRDILILTWGVGDGIEYIFGRLKNEWVVPDSDRR